MAGISRYFSPVEGPRVYFSGDSYCCPCNYRRIVSELPLMVFYRADNGLVVNLLHPAQRIHSGTRDVDCPVVQETDYPNSGRVQIRLDPSRSGLVSGPAANPASGHVRPV